MNNIEILQLSMLKLSQLKNHERTMIKIHFQIFQWTRIEYSGINS